MKKYSLHTKLHHPASKPRSIARKHHLPHAHWTPMATLALASLISYLLYALCSHIPVVSPQITGTWQLFG